MIDFTIKSPLDKKYLHVMKIVLLLSLMTFPIVSGSFVLNNNSDTSTERAKSELKNSVLPKNSLANTIRNEAKFSKSRKELAKKQYIGNNMLNEDFQGTNESDNHLNSPSSTYFVNNSNNNPSQSFSTPSKNSFQYAKAQSSINLDIYSNHAPISIDGNAQFATFATTNKLQGDGSQAGPYWMNRWSIDGNYTNTPVIIKNTNVYFTISNSFIQASVLDGIYLYNVSNARIENDTIVYNTVGLEMVNVTSSTIIKNTANYNDIYGFKLTNTSSNTIDSNHISNTEFGIISFTGNINTYSNNYVEITSKQGLHIESSLYSSILSNIFQTTGADAISITSGSNFATIQNNTMDDSSASGISVFDSNNADIFSNTANNTYYSGIYAVNITSSNIHINYFTFNSIGIEIHSSLSSNSIFSNYLHNQTNDGIFIQQSNFQQVQGNYIYGQNNQISGTGIEISQSNNISLVSNNINYEYSFGIYINTYNTNSTIKYNSISNNGWADAIRVGTHNDQTDILGNTIQYNRNGVNIYSYNSKVNVVSNTISYNQIDGISIYYSNSLVKISKNIIFQNIGGVGIDITYQSNEVSMIDNTISYCYIGIYLRYIVTNLLIDKNIISSNTHYGIYAYECSIGSMISNNTVDSNGYHGLYLDIYCSYVTVSSNEIIGNTLSGIALYQSSDNNIINNTVNYNHGDGVWLLTGSNNNLIANNTVIQNHVNGIEISGSGNTIENNSISYSINDGVVFNGASGNTFFNNTVEESSFWGISVMDSPNNNFTNNVILRDGFYIGSTIANDYNQVAFTNNKVNGLPILFAKDLTGGKLSTSGYGEVILFNSSNVEITGYTQTQTDVALLVAYSRNLNIHDNSFYSNYGYGLMLEYTNGSIIRNNNIYANNLDAVYINNYCYQNIVEYNNLHDNTEYGLYIHNSDQNTVTKNNITHNIANDLLLAQADNSTIENNLINGTYLNGLILDGSNYNYIYNNTIINCRENGIYIYSSSKNNTLDSNFINNNNQNGIKEQSATMNTVTNNLITYNVNFGIFSNETTDSIYSFNTLQNNGYSGIALYSDYNVLVENNVVSFNHYNGIYLNLGSYNILKGNKGYNNTKDGLNLGNENNALIENNEMYFNGWNGIALYSSSNNNKLLNNTVYQNTKNGMYLSNVKYNNITKNNISSNNEYGLSLSGSSDNYIDANNLSTDGLYITGSTVSDYYELSISDNTVNGKSLVFLYNQSGIVVPYGAGQIIIIDCNNIRVTNQTMTNTDIAILVVYSNRIFVYNNTIQNSQNYGLVLAETTNNSLVEINNFINNKIDNLSQAKDNGYNNTFKNNYWSDDVKSELNTFGVSLIPYDINGKSNNMDSSPLVYEIGAQLLTEPILQNSFTGSSVNGTITLTWSKSNSLLNHTVHYKIYISEDNGSTWILLSDSVTGTQFELNTLLFPNATTYRIMIIGIDDIMGQTITYIQESPFTIANASNTANPATTITTTSTVMPSTDTTSTSKSIHHDQSVNAIIMVSSLAGIGLAGVGGVAFWRRKRK